MRIALIVLGSIMVLLVILAYARWMYLNRSFLDFEKDHIEARVIPELSEKEYAYLDRNYKGELDLYEDDRQPMQALVPDPLQQMTIEEKIHMLKGAGLASAMGRIDPGTGIAGQVGTIVSRRDWVSPRFISPMDLPVCAYNLPERVLARPTTPPPFPSVPCGLPRGIQIS